MHHTTSVVCSLHVPKIIEFYLCIQMFLFLFLLPAKCKWLHFSWATLYIVNTAVIFWHRHAAHLLIWPMSGLSSVLR